ncbi:hypothetical protein [Streptomyces sp. NPDC002851]
MTRAKKTFVTLAAAAAALCGTSATAYADGHAGNPAPRDGDTDTVTTQDGHAGSVVTLDGPLSSEGAKGQEYTGG